MHCIWAKYTSAHVYPVDWDDCMGITRMEVLCYQKLPVPSGDISLIRKLSYY